jgi:hypothetical protein
MGVLTNLLDMKFLSFLGYKIYPTKSAMNMSVLVICAFVCFVLQHCLQGREKHSTGFALKLPILLPDGVSRRHGWLNWRILRREHTRT